MVKLTKPAGTIPFAEIIITTNFSCIHIFVPFSHGKREPLEEAQNKEFNWLNTPLWKGCMNYQFTRFFLIVLNRYLSTIPNDKGELAVEPDRQPNTLYLNYHSYVLRPRWDLTHIIIQSLICPFSINKTKKVINHP